MSQFQINSGLQVPVSVTMDDGRKVQILRGGYLRQVVLIKEVEARQVGVLNYGPRQYVEAVLGWVDNRSECGIDDQARILYGLHTNPEGQYESPEGPVVLVVDDGPESVGVLTGGTRTSVRRSKIAQHLFDLEVVKVYSRLHDDEPCHCHGFPYFDCPNDVRFGQTSPTHDPTAWVEITTRVAGVDPNSGEARYGPAAPSWVRTYTQVGDPERDAFGRCTLCGSFMDAYPYQQADHWLGEHITDWSTGEVATIA